MKTVMFIDEKTTIHKTILEILETQYAVIAAKDGAEALQLLANCEFNVSVVLIGLSLTTDDRQQLLKTMREDERLSIIPTIILEKERDVDTEVFFLKEGATEFITPPYQKEIILHRIQSLIRLQENSAVLNVMEYDRLTGICTKEYFYHCVSQLLRHNPEDTYDIICSDIENFRVINEEHGTKMGDQLLVYLANKHKEMSQETGVCGRIASNSFAMIIKHKEEYTQNSFHQYIQSVFYDIPLKHIEIKYGMYEITDRTIPVSAMCDRAMFAMQKIKHKYGVYFARYDDSIRVKMLREQRILDCMETALLENQFCVYYQPKHDIRTGKIAGAEALVRWIHPEFGFMSPGEFIPLFEKNGFISKLDHYVWEKVCINLAKWKKQNKNFFPVSVNVSRTDFELSDLVERIEHLVEIYDLSPEWLHLEVTESAYTDNPQQIIDTVEILRREGFKIEMDDFGSGYSSLNMLSELPIDYLKLDMQFMQKHNNVANNRSILSFIVSLSKWLGLPTIAEGVEKEEDYQLLKSMGCNYVQGYYYAKPMSEQDFEEYTSKNLDNIDQTEDDNLGSNSFVIEGRKNERVLIIEDIEMNRRSLQMMLEPYYKVETAQNGLEALEQLKKYGQKISVILLDLMMPVMDGFQFLEFLKKEKALIHIPIIITSESGKDSELNALRLGAVNFIAKPYQREILLHHIQTAIDCAELKKIKKDMYKLKNINDDRR